MTKVQLADSLGGAERRCAPLILHQNWEPLWLAALQNPLCAAVPQRFLLPSPHSTASLQAPGLLLQSLASKIPYLSFQVPFSQNCSGRFLSALASASKFVYQTHPIKVLRKQEDSAVTRNHPHYVCVNVKWRGFPRQHSNIYQHVKYTYLLTLKPHC